MGPQKTTRVFGGGEFLYEVDPAWPQVPESWSFHEVAGAATDSQDRVYVFNRGEHPVMVFHADGTFLSSWGEGEFDRAHGIWIGRSAISWRRVVSRNERQIGLRHRLAVDMTHWHQEAP